MSGAADRCLTASCRDGAGVSLVTALKMALKTAVGRTLGIARGLGSGTIKPAAGGELQSSVLGRLFFQLVLPEAGGGCLPGWQAVD